MGAQCALEHSVHWPQATQRASLRSPDGVLLFENVGLRASEPRPSASHAWLPLVRGGVPTRGLGCVQLLSDRTSEGRGGSAEDAAGPISASGVQSPAADACAAVLLSAHPSVADAPTALLAGPCDRMLSAVVSMFYCADASLDLSNNRRSFAFVHVTRAHLKSRNLRSAARSFGRKADKSNISTSLAVTSLAAFFASCTIKQAHLLAYGSSPWASI